MIPNFSNGCHCEALITYGLFFGKKVKYYYHFPFEIEA